MIRLALVALAVAIPVGEAFASQHVSAVPGAVAGRSPHVAYRPAATTMVADACATVAASGPAGRLATHAAPARPAAHCAAVRMADRDESHTIGRD